MYRVRVGISEGKKERPPRTATGAPKNGCPQKQQTLEETAPIAWHPSYSQSYGMPCYAHIQWYSAGVDEREPQKALAEKRKRKWPAGDNEDNSRTYAPPERYAHLNGVPDAIDYNLILLLVGLNPGVTTATVGHAWVPVFFLISNLINPYL